MFDATHSGGHAVVRGLPRRHRGIPGRRCHTRAPMLRSGSRTGVPVQMVSCSVTVRLTMRNALRQSMAMAVVAALLTAAGCGESGSAGGPQVTAPSPAPTAVQPLPAQGLRTITYGGVSVQVVIDQPAGPVRDAMLLFHGTVWFDDRIVPAAQLALDNFRRLLVRHDLLLVSVAYPQQDRAMGDGVREAEAALLWVKHEASRALGVTVDRIFLAGHSQGGYVVTRLNTMHPTAGVIASAPGPLDFEFRCLLEERGSAPASPECGVMVQRYGVPSVNPGPYRDRSLLSFTSGLLADELFVQGLADAAIQMRSWPLFRQALDACTSCQRNFVLEIPGGPHEALFMSAEAREAFNRFLDQRRSGG
jgi:hypothetical protein